VDTSAKSDFLAEHLRVFGLDVAFLRDRVVLVPKGSARCSVFQANTADDIVFVFEQPDDETLASLGLDTTGSLQDRAQEFVSPRRATYRLRSLSPAFAYSGQGWNTILLDEFGQSVWLSRNFGTVQVVVVGTALVSDLLTLRQGDPQVIRDKNSPEMWGFSYERPNYLFEKTAPDADSLERLADFWIDFLASEIALIAGIERLQILPQGAPGALVITGDDDQAALDRYRLQLQALNGLPVTYFLHPLTHLTRELLQDFTRSNSRVEFGIHPDALETPADYSLLFDQQCKWFGQLTDKSPKSVRNHGYLNDGYWGHLSAWLKHKVVVSSNIPGLNGQVVTHSLIPMRVLIDETLTSHWSILTLFGDGMIYALGMSDEEAAARVLRACEKIRRSGIPGVIVVNVHPQNFPDTVALHAALRSISESDFVTWNISEMYSWFESRVDVRPTHRHLLNKVLHKITKRDSR